MEQSGKSAISNAQTDKVRPCPEHTSLWYWVMLLIAIAFTAGLRIRLLDVPLERDEGEYAYAGQLILRAIPPTTKYTI